MIKNFVVSMVLFLALDWIWFSLFMKKFALTQLRPLLKLSGENMDVNMPAALFAYVSMAVLVAVFLAPLLSQDNYTKSILLSGLLGFLAFAIFDFTNLALFKNYPVVFVVADVAWGTFLFSVVGASLLFLKKLTIF